MERIDAVFVNVSARYDLPHRAEPIKDLEIASGGVVKVYEDRQGNTYPDMPWEPKAGFHALSNYYNRE